MKRWWCTTIYHPFVIANGLSNKINTTLTNLINDMDFLDCYLSRGEPIITLKCCINRFGKVHTFLRGTRNSYVLYSLLLTPSAIWGSSVVPPVGLQLIWMTIKVNLCWFRYPFFSVCCTNPSRGGLFSILFFLESSLSYTLCWQYPRNNCVLVRIYFPFCMMQDLCCSWLCPTCAWCNT